MEKKLGYLKYYLKNKHYQQLHFCFLQKNKHLELKGLANKLLNLQLKI